MPAASVLQELYERPCTVPGVVSSTPIDRDGEAKAVQMLFDCFAGASPSTRKLMTMHVAQLGAFAWGDHDAARTVARLRLLSAEAQRKIILAWDRACLETSVRETRHRRLRSLRRLMKCLHGDKAPRIPPPARLHVAPKESNVP